MYTARDLELYLETRLETRAYPLMPDAVSFELHPMPMPESLERSMLHPGGEPMPSHRLASAIAPCCSMGRYSPMALCRAVSRYAASYALCYRVAALGVLGGLLGLL